MTLKRICIKRLFGHLDYDLDVDNPEHVCIMLGKNGSGKTTILQLIHDLSRSDFEAISRVVFTEFQALLEGEGGGQYVERITVTMTKEPGKEMQIEFSHVSGDRTEAKNLGLHAFLDEKDMYVTQEKIRRLLDTTLIPAQRLHDETATIGVHEIIKEACERGNIKEETSDLLAEVMRVASSREITRNAALVKDYLEHVAGISEILSDSQKRERFIRQRWDEMDLMVAQHMYECHVEKFFDIVNEFLSGKKLVPSATDGYRVELDDGHALDAGLLSSGEKSLIIMFTRLLVNGHCCYGPRPWMLFLIDEPEAYLHVGWQRAFLRAVKDIQQLTKGNYIIATHSPHIVHDRQDLCHQLGPIDGQ